jgi:hypothetical protein
MSHKRGYSTVAPSLSYKIKILQSYLYAQHTLCSNYPCIQSTQFKTVTITNSENDSNPMTTQWNLLVSVSAWQQTHHKPT